MLLLAASRPEYQHRARWLLPFMARLPTVSGTFDNVEAPLQHSQRNQQLLQCALQSYRTCVAAAVP